MCNGHEDVLRQCLVRDETDGEEQTDGGEEREGERGSESLRNTDINAYDSFGLTSMHYAARLNRYEMMSNLVKKNAGKIEGKRERGLCILVCVYICK